jgi:AcrR family transcriptional regulator
METQERIVYKAHELFIRYGIRSVSMDEIANHLGISKKTIYQFYADKDALVESVLDIELNKNKDLCSQQNEVCENAIQEVFQAMELTQEMFLHLNPSVIYDLEKYHPKAFKKFSDYKNGFLYDSLVKNIERGKKEEVYRSDLNADVLAKFRIATILLIFDTEVFPQSQYKMSRILEEITDHFLHGLASPKGQKFIQKYNQERQKNIV